MATRRGKETTEWLTLTRSVGGSGGLSGSGSIAPLGTATGSAGPGSILHFRPSSETVHAREPLVDLPHPRFADARADWAPMVEPAVRRKTRRCDVPGRGTTETCMHLRGTQQLGYILLVTFCRASVHHAETAHARQFPSRRPGANGVAWVGLASHAFKASGVVHSVKSVPPCACDICIRST